MPSGVGEFLPLKDHLAYCRNIAQERLTNVDVMKVYHMMGDVARNKNYALLREGRKRPLILIADGDSSAADFIKAMIAKEYDILCVNSGTAAIREYIQRAPDCILLDLATPGLSGLETSVCIKAVDIHAFVVMISNDAVQQKIIDSFNSGAGDFIKKPFPKARLIQAIQKSPYIGGGVVECLEDMQKSEEVILF